VAHAVQPGEALPARLDQPFVLVEPDRTGGDRELAGELGNAVDARRVARRGTFGRNGRGGGGRHASVIVDVYVNVNSTKRLVNLDTETKNARYPGGQRASNIRPGPKTSCASAG